MNATPPRFTLVRRGLPGHGASARARDRGPRGFTLMEVMIAVSILGLIITIIWTSFGRMLNVRDHVVAIQERYHGISVALTRVSRELSMAYISRHVSSDQRTKTFFKAKREGEGFRVMFSGLSGMKLYRDANQADTVVISYFLESDPESGRMNLMRREVPRLVPDATAVEAEYPAYVLCESVSKFELELFDPQQNEWVDAWDSEGVEKSNRLPTLVRVRLGVIDDDGKELVIPTTAKVWMRDMLTFGWR